MRTDVPLIVPVDPAGGWDVELPDQHARVRCETLDDAKRVAFLHAAHSHACTVVVRDAYHRVLEEEFIASDRRRARVSATRSRPAHRRSPYTLICTTPGRAALSRRDSPAPYPAGGCSTLSSLNRRGVSSSRPGGLLQRPQLQLLADYEHRAPTRLNPGLQSSRDGTRSRGRVLATRRTGARTDPAMRRITIPGIPRYLGDQADEGVTSVLCENQLFERIRGRGSLGATLSVSSRASSSPTRPSAANAERHAPCPSRPTS